VRQLSDIELTLQQLVAEHHKLLKHVEMQQEAMKIFALDKMDDATNLQEATRLRIATLENRRRAIAMQIAKAMRLNGDLTIKKLAEMFPQRAPVLLQHREELRNVIEQIQTRTHVAGRLAGAVLGHLNTVVRLVSGAVERAGVYTKNGVPQVSKRIGVMEAVG
jgi:hypothetical protein